MNATGRRLMFLLAAPIVAALLLRALAGLPGFGDYPGPYGDIINHVAYYERHVTNMITAISFDYRGFDTLNEEFMLFAAVTGVVVLLRGDQGESSADKERPNAPGRERLPRSDDAQWMSMGYLGLLVVFGIYVVIHGQLTPGGGFQGGAITGSATLLIYLTRNYGAFRRVMPKETADVLESVGAAAYALIGIATLIAGGALLQNMLPLGMTGELYSSGTIQVINFAVGFEVAAGFAVLFLEFAEEIRQPIPDDTDDQDGESG